MTAPPDPRVIAEVGGLVVAEDGPLVIVVDRRIGPLATAAFVLGVLALVLGGFGAVTLLLAGSVSRWLSAIFVCVGIVFAGGAFAAVHRVRRARTRPLSDYRPVAVFDRARRVYADGNGVVVATLDHVRFQNHMQFASSSSALVAVTPSGTRILKRGNPFSGGLGSMPATLTDVVFGQPR